MEEKTNYSAKSDTEVSSRQCFHTNIVLCGGRIQICEAVTNEWCRKHRNYKPLKLFAQDMSNLIELNKKELDCMKSNASFITLGGLDFLFSQVDSLCHVTRQCVPLYRKSLVLVIADSEVESLDITLSHLYKHRIPFVCVSSEDSMGLVQITEAALRGQTPNDTKLNERFALSLKFFIQDKYKADCIRLRKLVVTTSHITEEFTSLPKGKSNRMIARYGADNFLLADFNFKMQPREVSAILSKGIWLDGEKYEFIGCSSSGLKKRSCYLMRGSEDDIKRIRDVECINLPNDTPVPKRLKGIGLLFSNVIFTGVEVNRDSVVLEDDILSSDRRYNFTDGCGAIGSRLHGLIVERAGLNNQLPENYKPSVLQIRLEGYKGVVALDPTLDKDSILVRKSMMKFKSGTKPFPEVCLCNYSKPYSVGYLNKQYIMLLSGLGVADEILTKKQEDYYSQMEKLKKSPEVSFNQLCISGQYQLATQVATGNMNDTDVQEELSRIQRKFIEKIAKLKIQVPDSRTVFGICDTLQVLNYGECFFRPTINGEPYTITGKVLVAKNPCYFLGDVRVLTAVGGKRVEGLQHLIDCVVFPTKGQRPHPDEITGSDLDGDQYFVCWDEELSIEKMRNPTDFEALSRASTSKNPYKWKNCVEYVANQVSLMGLLNSHYLYWAETKGVQSDECQELGQLFSHSVDASKTGDRFMIPKHLRPPKGKSGVAAKLDAVWRKMDMFAEEWKQKFIGLSLQPSGDAHFSEAFVLTILQDQSRNIPEFELFKLLRKWCYSQSYSDSTCHEKMIQFSRFINFGKFSLQQKLSALEMGVPVNLVTNALNSSQFLPVEVAQKFSLHDPHNRWCFFFNAAAADFKWADLLHAITTYPESLLIYKLPSGITFALHFLSELSLGETKILTGSVISYFFSSSFKLLHRHVLGSSYFIDLNGEFLQIYRNGNKGNSFVWIANTMLESVAPAETKFDRMSVDLTTFQKDIFRKYSHPKINKQSFDALEVFVKSGTEEPTYKDSLSSDVTCDDAQLEDSVPLEEISRDEIEKQESLAPPTEASEVELLHFYASQGRIQDFSTVLASMLNTDGFKIEISQETCLLLSSVVNECVHFRQPMKFPDQLFPITVSAGLSLSSPQNSVLVLSKFSMLCSAEFTEKVKDSLLSCLQMKTILEYIETLLHWEHWYFLPQTVANSLAKTLYTLSKSLLPDIIEAPSSELLDLVVGGGQRTSSGLIEQYTHHYAYLLHLSFLNEVNSLKSQQPPNSFITKLKVYNPCCQQTSDMDSHLDTKSSSKLKKKIEFHNKTQGVAFNLEGYAIVSFMSSEVEMGFVPVTWGIITDMSRQPVNVVIEVPSPMPACIENSIETGVGHWQLNVVGNVTTYLRGMKALRLLAEKGEAATDLIPVLTHPKASLCSTELCSSKNPNRVLLKCAEAPWSQQGESDLRGNADKHSHVELNAIRSSREVVVLNEKQKEALASSMTNRLTLIHGPPGTGKTKVACEIVHHYCSSRLVDDDSKHSKILIAAETNMAVDNMARLLMLQGVNVVRVGSREQISTDVYSQISLTVLASSESLSKSAYIDQKRAKEVLERAEVIAATCSGAGDSILKSFKFPVVIIDEATQVMEPISLIPITKSCKKLILIGDPEQLAPFHLSHSHTVQGTDAEPQVQDLAVTLFHRLHKVLPSVFLEEQYRMSPALVQFPSQKFYKGRLICSLSVKERSRNFELKSENATDFVEVHTSKERHVGGPSLQNDAEAGVVADIIDHLISCNVSPNEITILTPYRKQVQCIIEKLSQQRVSKVEVSTIDNFQGKENDVIVFSMVRSTPHGDFQFIAKRNRINVLLTRARHYVVGVGCKAVLEKVDLWKDWLQQANVIISDRLNMLSIFDPQQKSGKSKSLSSGSGESSGEFTSQKGGSQSHYRSHRDSRSSQSNRRSQHHGGIGNNGNHQSHHRPLTTENSQRPQHFYGNSGSRTSHWPQHRGGGRNDDGNSQSHRRPQTTGNSPRPQHHHGSAGSLTGHQSHHRPQSQRPQHHHGSAASGTSHGPHQHHGGSSTNDGNSQSHRRPQTMQNSRRPQHCHGSAASGTSHQSQNRSGCSKDQKYHTP